MSFNWIIMKPRNVGQCLVEDYVTTQWRPMSYWIIKKPTNVGHCLVGCLCDHPMKGVVLVDDFVTTQKSPMFCWMIMWPIEGQGLRMIIWSPNEGSCFVGWVCDHPMKAGVLLDDHVTTQLRPVYFGWLRCSSSTYTCGERAVMYQYVLHCVRTTTTAPSNSDR